MVIVWHIMSGWRGHSLRVRGQPPRLRDQELATLRHAPNLGTVFVIKTPTVELEGLGGTDPIGFELPGPPAGRVLSLRPDGSILLHLAPGEPPDAPQTCATAPIAEHCLPTPKHPPAGILRPQRPLPQGR